MKLYIGITNEDELYFIEWDKVDNEQRQTFTLCGGTYDNPKTETEGGDEAREKLESGEYWEEIYNLNELPAILTNNFNYKDIAEESINLDGWENVNGEYSHFGEFENEEIYLNYSSGGQHQEKRNNLKKLWIGENDFKTLNSLWNKEHLKNLKETTSKKMEEIFNHYEKKGLCSDEEVLNKFLKGIEWRQ